MGGGFGGNGSGGGVGVGGVGLGGDGGSGIGSLCYPKGSPNTLLILSLCFVERANTDIGRFLGFARNSKLLQPLTVNLVNANIAPDKIPIFLVRKTASARRPGQFTRRFWVIGIVNKIALDSRIRRKRFLFIN